MKIDIGNRPKARKNMGKCFACYLKMTIFVDAKSVEPQKYKTTKQQNYAVHTRSTEHVLCG